MKFASCSRRRIGSKAAAIAVVAASVGIPLAVFAQAGYPSKPIHLISPFPAGGGSDVLARALGDKIAASMGQPVVVENRTGASGNIGTQYVARSAPDGYTLMLTVDTLVINQAMPGKPPYSVLDDFAPVAMVGTSSVVIGVNPTVPATTVGQLVALAKADPSKFSYATCGNGTAPHLAGELFKSMAKVDMPAIQYRGCSVALVDSVAGHVPVFTNILNAVAPLEKAGKLRILAVASAKRSSFAPNVPTIAEAGFPGYEAEPWYGVLAPAGTPPEIVARLNKELIAALNSDDLKEKLKNQMIEPRISSPEEFGAVIKNDLNKWTNLIRAAGIKAE